MVSDWPAGETVPELTGSRPGTVSHWQQRYTAPLGPGPGLLAPGSKIADREQPWKRPGIHRL